MKSTTKAAAYFLSGLAIGAIVITTIASRKIDPATTPVEMSAEGRPHYKWYAPHVPSSIDFCGENVPLDRWEVREKLDRELLVNTYLHGSQLYILKLAGRYFPIIEERLKANGVPPDLKYVCVAESALQQNAWSSVGAASFWQFMKDTGPRYGLEINDEVDERFNVVKATDAACQYFKEAYSKFGSWTAAAASYNCGMAGFAKQAEFQQSNNYYDLIFPEETNRYVFRIVALKHLLSNAKKYGMMIEEGDEYKPLKARTVLVDKSITNLTEFAVANGTTYKMLKIYNPWLRDRKLTVKPGKTYEIQLPM
ncbi:MAG: lytic transglycosylase domain-containing protein [Chitinophagaceae bacterium]|nr:lytic transglycosylase domain-containing protein [Chitinophagaceae bacterium]